MDRATGVLNRDRPARPLRVLFLVAQFDTGGVQFQLRLRLQHLDRERFEPRVAILTSGRSRFLDEIHAMSVPVDVLGVDRAPGLVSRVRALRAYIAAVRPDVVDSLLAWDNTYGNLAATLAGVPFVVAELQNHRDALRRTYPVSFRWFEALALRFFCDRIVCCSDAVRDSYRRVLAGAAAKMSVIHDAIDAALPMRDRDAVRAALDLAPDTPVVATIGRLLPQKDHATLLSAVDRLRRRHAGVQVLIGGYGALHDDLQAQARALGIQDHVRFLGEIEDPYALYAAADTFVMTSQWEGFPVVLLEAMATGVAAVSTEVGGIAEMIADGRSGRLCAPGDADAVAAALGDLLDDAALRLRLGRAGRAHVLGRFAIQQLAPRWTALYETGGRRAAPATCGPAAGRTTATSDAAGAAFEWPGEAARILACRTCPAGPFGELVGDVRRRYPTAEIDVLCQQDMVDRLLTDPARVRPVPYGTGFFRLSKLGAAGLLALRRRRYDLVVLPYNTPSRVGYWRAELVALLVGRGEVCGRAAWDAPHPAAWRLTWLTRLAAATWSLVSGPGAYAHGAVTLAQGLVAGLRRRRLLHPSFGGSR